MTSEPSVPKKIHSLFPDSPTNRLLRAESTCGCLYFRSLACLTPAQTYAIPPVISLETCPSSERSTLIDHEGPIEYRRGLSSLKGTVDGELRENPYWSTYRSDIAPPKPCKGPQVYVCWSVNWDGPIPPYPGLPPGRRDNLQFPSTFILDGSLGNGTAERRSAGTSLDLGHPLSQASALPAFRTTRRCNPFLMSLLRHSRPT